MQYGAYVGLKYLQFFASHFWALILLALIIAIYLINKNKKKGK